MLLTYEYSYETIDHSFFEWMGLNMTEWNILTWLSCRNTTNKPQWKDQV